VIQDCRNSALISHTQHNSRRAHQQIAEVPVKAMNFIAARTSLMSHLENQASAFQTPGDGADGADVECDCTQTAAAPEFTESTRSFDMQNVLRAWFVLFGSDPKVAAETRDIIARLGGVWVSNSEDEAVNPRATMPAVPSKSVGRIKGRGMDASDVRASTVDLRVLEAWIKAGLSNQPGSATVPASNIQENCKRFRFGKTWLDLDSARLTGDDGNDVPITSMEFNLLKLFARNRGRVLNRDQILEGAHDREWEPFDRSIDIRISRIRRKIEVNLQKPVAIRTVRGIGYIYDDQPT
jgi:DNA-binding winged helix-turn-helix (wHTH) protein